LCVIWVFIFACWKYVHSEHTSNNGGDENRVVIIDTLINTKQTNSVIKVNTIKKPKTVSQKRLSIYTQTRLLVGQKESGKNSGKVVNIVIKHTGLDRFKSRPYCGATVQYCLEKAKVDLPKDVKSPLMARGWFNENIIFYKGKYVGVYKTEPAMGDIAGFNFYGNNITHVGIYLKDSLGNFKVFEGNTSNPKNRKQEGFFDKSRDKEITIIRKLL
jgi:hypothetical protein